MFQNIRLDAASTSNEPKETQWVLVFTKPPKLTDAIINSFSPRSLHETPVLKDCTEHLLDCQPIHNPFQFLATPLLLYPPHNLGGSHVHTTRPQTTDVSLGLGPWQRLSWARRKDRVQLIPPNTCWSLKQRCTPKGRAAVFHHGETEVEDAGQGWGGTELAQREKHRRTGGKTPLQRMLGYTSLSLRHICSIQLKPKSGGILLFAIKHGDVDIHIGKENLIHQQRTGFFIAGLPPDFNMIMCVKNIQEQNKQRAFPKLIGPQKPFFMEYLFSHSSNIYWVLTMHEHHPRSLRYSCDPGRKKDACLPSTWNKQ